MTALRTDRRTRATELRDQHPTLIVDQPVTTRTPDGWELSWRSHLDNGPTFTSRLAIDTRTPHSAPNEILHMVAAIDAWSYWKAAVPTKLRFNFELPGNQNWWDQFTLGAMSEFLWTNGLDPTWLPTIDATFSGTITPPQGTTTLLLHSGGKDSWAAGRLLDHAGRPVRPVTYQPTDLMRSAVADSAPATGWAGTPLSVRRTLDPQLLDLNRGDYLNGHTPYSAWLATAALAAAYCVNAGHVAAGNSRSDDGSNIDATHNGHPWHINHQFTKSHQFEHLLAQLFDNGVYASPLRPIFELGVLAGLHTRQVPGAVSALSCNRSVTAGHPGSWCLTCPKCVWTALATRALTNSTAVQALMGSDPLDDPTNRHLVEAMTGTHGPIPFECAGRPFEVRACITEILNRESAPQALDELNIGLVDELDGNTTPTVNEILNATGPAPLLTDEQHKAAQEWPTARS